jgi:hypothetical protein
MSTGHHTHPSEGRIDYKELEKDKPCGSQDSCLRVSEKLTLVSCRLAEYLVLPGLWCITSLRRKRLSSDSH